MAIIFILCISCTDTNRMGMMPGLANADSAAIMFYSTPGNPRFFSYVKEHDIKTLQTLINDANGKIIEPLNDCPTQGKIYFYGLKGAVDVVYFSNSEHCMTLSFIITGEKYFVNMSRRSNDLLSELKLLGKEPASNN